MTTKTVKVDPKHIDLEELRQVAGELLRGKLVAFPTETVYGIGVSAHCPQAVERLYHLKKRERSKPFAYHIGSLEMLERLNVIQNRAFRFFAAQFWPGPVSFVALNRRDEKVGLRFPSDPVALRLLEFTREPVLATSANVSGAPSPRTVDEVLKSFPNEIDIVLDGGACRWGEDSTIVDVISMPPRIARRGANADRVEAAIQRVEAGRFPRKKILIVCTGNICRSPMAEAWLLHELKRKGLEGQIEVASCGVCAREGSPASLEAVLTLKNDEISIEHFRSHCCRREDLVFADLILVMSEEHERFVTGLCAGAKDRLIVLGVSDPIGMSVEVYQKCYEEIRQKITQIWNEVVK